MSEKTMLDNLMKNAGGGSVTDTGKGYLVKGNTIAVTSMLSACISALMHEGEMPAIVIAEIVAASVSSVEKEMAREAGRQVQ